jgi:hypothetical protein
MKCRGPPQILKGVRLYDGIIDIGFFSNKKLATGHYIKYLEYGDLLKLGKCDRVGLIHKAVQKYGYYSGTEYF